MSGLPDFFTWILLRVRNLKYIPRRSLVSPSSPCHLSPHPNPKGHPLLHCSKPKTKMSSFILSLFLSSTSDSSPTRVEFTCSVCFSQLLLPYPSRPDQFRGLQRSNTKGSSRALLLGIEVQSRTAWI